MMVRLEGYGKKTAGGSLSFQLWDQSKMGRGRILAGSIMHSTGGNAVGTSAAATSRSARHVMVVDKLSSKDKVIEDLSAVGYEGNIYSLDNFASFMGKEGLKHVSANFKNNRRKRMLGRSSAAVASSAAAPVGSGGAAASSSAAPFNAQKDNADFEDDVDMENVQGAEADPAKLGGGAAASSSAAVVSPKAFEGDVDGDADLPDEQAVEAAGSSGVPVDGVAIIEYSEMGWTLGGNAGKKGADKTELVKQVVRWFNDGGGHGMLIFDDAHKLCMGTGTSRNTASKAGGADANKKEQGVIAEPGTGKDTKKKKPSPKAKGKAVSKAKTGKMKFAKEELAISSDDESSSDDPLRDLMGMGGGSLGKPKGGLLKKLQPKKAAKPAAATMKRASEDIEFEGPEEIDQKFLGPMSNSVKNAVMLVRDCPSAKIVTASGVPATKLQGLAHLFRSGLWPMLNAANPVTPVTKSPLTAAHLSLFSVGDAEVEKIYPRGYVFETRRYARQVVSTLHFPFHLSPV